VNRYIEGVSNRDKARGSWNYFLKSETEETRAAKGDRLCIKET